MVSVIVRLVVVRITRVLRYRVAGWCIVKTSTDIFIIEWDCVR